MGGVHWLNTRSRNHATAQPIAPAMVVSTTDSVRSCRKIRQRPCKARKPGLRRQDLLVNHTTETIATLDTSLAPGRRRRDRGACRVRRSEEGAPLRDRVTCDE